MDKLNVFVFKSADKVLGKDLLQEIKSILRSPSKINHHEIQEMFSLWNWSLERYMLPNVTWRWDAYKEKNKIKIAVSVELSKFNAVPRDFLRAILMHKHGELDVLIYVTSTFNKPKFRNVKRDIEIFKELLDFPILLIGLT